MNINELDVWENEVPVVIHKEDAEFAVWENEVPVENQREPEVTTVRRRTSIF